MITEIKPPEKHISYQEIIETIEFEIERIIREYKKPGWTDWAIYGGFALILWSLIRFPEKDTLNILNIAQISLTGFLIYESLSIFNFLYSPTLSRNSNFITFNRTSHLQSPKTIFSNIIVSLLAVITALIAYDGVWIIQIVM